MKTYPDKCTDINMVDSFCSSICGEGTVDPAARGFCDRGRTGKIVIGEKLAELKKALMDLEDEACCS
jgi:hypothetical protein